jgi:hypothetical protein
VLAPAHPHSSSKSCPEWANTGGHVIYRDYFAGIQQRAVSPDNRYNAYVRTSSNPNRAITGIEAGRRGHSERHLLLAVTSGRAHLQITWTAPNHLEILCTQCSTATITHQETSWQTITVTPNKQ